MIRLIMEPNIVPMSWERFCSQTKPYSIAIDGYVNVGPRFQNLKTGGPRANYNHHEEVDRMATRATCSQVLMATRLGLFDLFRDEQGPLCQVYANDCDQDVCTAWFVLKHGWLAEYAINPRLNKLIHMEDMLDTSAGAYPFPKDMPILQKLAWVFQPYTNFRLNNGLNSRDPEQFLSVVTNVEHRILRYLHGEEESCSLDVRYEKIGGGSSWTMVEEIGAQARTGMFADRIRSFVSVSERSDQKFNYTIGRMSNLIPFDVLGLIDVLNLAEGNKDDLWGGGNTIGGSPRVGGSSLHPKDVEDIINKFIVEQ